MSRLFMSRNDNSLAIPAAHCLDHDPCHASRYPAIRIVEKTGPDEKRHIEHDGEHEQNDLSEDSAHEKNRRNGDKPTTHHR